MSDCEFILKVIFEEESDASNINNRFEGVCKADDKEKLTLLSRVMPAHIDTKELHISEMTFSTVLDGSSLKIRLCSFDSDVAIVLDKIAEYISRDTSKKTSTHQIIYSFDYMEYYISALIDGVFKDIYSAGKDSEFDNELAELENVDDVLDRVIETSISN